MNQVLLEQIVQHIYANLGILPASFVNQESSLSLLSKTYRLDKNVLFKDDEGKFVKNHVYGCQASLGPTDFTILVANCSQNQDVAEFAVLVELTGNPTYGLYLACDSDDMQALVAVSIENNNWMPCDTFLQATLLVAMEHLKSLNLVWKKPDNYHKYYDRLVSLISFHHSYYEVDNEGEEVRS